MNRKQRAKMEPELLEETECVDVLAAAVQNEPGIVRATFDPQEAVVSFSYDPQVAGEQDIERLAQTVQPALQERWTTCTMRLGRQGGRACEACALSVENRLQHIPGVRRATVSYLGGAMSISYDNGQLTEAQLKETVRALGVKTAPSAAALPEAAPAESGVFSRIRAQVTRDRLELLFMVLTLIGLVTGFVAERLEAQSALVFVAYAVAYLAGGTFGLKAGLESLRELTIDVDLLMILAALGAALVGAPFEGAMLLFLFSLSNVLQNYALDRTRNAIRALMKLRPNEALVRRGEETVLLPIDSIQLGDLIIVRPGERIALDGVVQEGESSVDQSAVTGESIPVARGPGDKVLAGTINSKGSLEVSVTHLAQDSTIARLIRMVEEAQSEKAKTQRFIDRAEQYYALGVILLTAGAIVVPLVFLEEAFAASFYRAMTLMVAASPCALVISTPATVLSAIGNGARQGVLFKGGAYVEQLAGIKVVAFDKTGTLTEGKPEVTDVVALQGEEAQLLTQAAAVEARSEHPLAQAIVAAAQERGLELPEADGFQSDTGQGVMATVEGRLIAIGNERFLSRYEAPALEEAVRAADQLHRQGKTAVMVARIEDRRAEVLGVIGIADVLRPDAPSVIKALKERGVVRVVMLTGDNERVAQAIAERAGVDAYHAGLLPEDKMRILKEEEAQYGPVAMVGDGVNDAPALATAAIGIAMGAAGTDVALETADIVLMADDLSKIPYVIGLSRKTRQTLWQNLVFATGVIIILIGAVLGFDLALPLSVIGHEGSTVLVSLNGLRLLAYRE